MLSRDQVIGLVNEAAGRHGVAPSLARAVAWVESRFKPEAVSPAGARGVMQLMPATAQTLGVNADDPEQNIDGGVRFLATLIQRFGGVRKALAAYNWGPARVASGRPFPSQVRAYVDHVLAREAIEAGGSVKPEPEIPFPASPETRPRLARATVLGSPSQPSSRPLGSTSGPDVAEQMGAVASALEANASVLGSLQDHLDRFEDGIFSLLHQMRVEQQSCDQWLRGRPSLQGEPATEQRFQIVAEREGQSQGVAVNLSVAQANFAPHLFAFLREIEPSLSSLRLTVQPMPPSE